MKQISKLLIAVILFTAITPTLRAQVNKQDSLALVDLYDSTGGANWTNHTNWLTKAPMSSWYGVGVISGYVNVVHLVNNNLTGIIPSSIGQLSNLQELFLDSNHIGGRIPSSIGNLSNLVSLWLNSNQITDTIPSEVGNLIKLRSLNLEVNTLSGNIPTSLGNLSGSLQVLDLGQNKLTGSIPASLGNLVNIVEFYLNFNQLAGSIPPSLGNLASVKYLYLSSNKLTDTIPSTFSNLTNLVWLNLGFNKLSGTLPSWLSSLQNLNGLGLGYNQFTGSIPISFGNFKRLTLLNLSSNQLTGEIPSELGNVTTLTTIALNYNQLTGSIPTSFGNLKNLQQLFLYGNLLTGTVPSAIGNLVKLIQFSLSDNQLSGSVPSSLKNLVNLAQLSLNKNQLTFDGVEQIVTKFPFTVYAPQATVPIVNNSNTLSISVGGTPSNNTFKWYKDSKLVATKVGDSTYTAIADGKYWVVATNAIATQLTLYSDTVTINSFINNQDSLALVDFYNSTNGANWKDNSNWLTAKPLNTWKGIVLDSSGRVSEINLYINNLTGKLPASIGNLTNLTTISLHINSIGGNIPPSIGRLTNLKELDLGENVFTGMIPDSLANLTKLNQLDLSINELTGSIPSWIGNFTNLQNLWLQYNYLSDSIPSSIGNLTGLQYLVLQNNQLSGPIPASFGNLSKLKGLFLQNNKFTFDGMELIATKFPFAEYAPQATIPIYKVMIPEGGPVGLSVEVGGTPVNNTYNWYNDSGLIGSINKYPFYDASVSGYYYVHVTNSLVPGLTLYSDTVKVDVIMPVKSIYLQTKTINGQVLVQWKTINELNAKSFTIQHSTNGVDFTDINTKEAMGSGSNNYSLTDKLPTGSINYYRIEAVDKDGSFTYSNVALLTTYDSRLTTFTVVPNPVRDVVTIKGSHISLVQVIDNMGKVISNTSLKDATNPTLSVSGLAAGNYLLHLKTTTGEQQVVKFVKE